jgi:integrase
MQYCPNASVDGDPLRKVGAGSGRQRLVADCTYSLTSSQISRQSNSIEQGNPVNGQQHVHRTKAGNATRRRVAFLSADWQGPLMRKMPKAQDRRCLSPDEAHRLIETVGLHGRHRFRDKVLVGLVYRHGMRGSEAVKLRWSDMDLESGILHLVRTRRGDVDTAHSLNDDELRDLLSLREQATGLYVFETARGIPLTVVALQGIVRRAGKLADLHVRSLPNMLQRAAAIALASEGADARLIQAFLGHKGVRRSAPDSTIPPERLAAVRVR